MFVSCLRVHHSTRIITGVSHARSEQLSIQRAESNSMLPLLCIRSEIDCFLPQLCLDCTFIAPAKTRQFPANCRPSGRHFSKLLYEKSRPRGRHLILASPVFRLYPAMPFWRFRHRFSVQPSLNHTTVGIEAARTEQAYDKPADDFFHEYLPPCFLIITQYNLFS